MKKIKLTNKNIRKSVLWIARSYYDFEKSLKSISDKSEYTLKDINLNLKNRIYYDAIKYSFDNSVNDKYKERVWEYFYRNKQVGYYEEIIVKNEIEKWLYYLSLELGLNISEK